MQMMSVYKPTRQVFCFRIDYFLVWIKKKEHKQLCSFSVDLSGEMSNFLPEDFNAVWKFMNAEMQKKKRKL